MNTANCWMANLRTRCSHPVSKRFDLLQHFDTTKSTVTEFQSTFELQYELMILYWKPFPYNKGLQTVRCNDILPGCESYFLVYIELFNICLFYSFIAR